MLFSASRRICICYLEVLRLAPCNLRPQGNSILLNTPRTFATSTYLSKNRHGHKNFAPDEQSSSSTHPEVARGSNASNGKDGIDINSSTMPLTDATNLVSLKSEVQQIQEKLRKGLGGLKSGGRFNPALIETLRVDLSKLKGANNATETKETQVEDSSAPKTKKQKAIKTKSHTKPTIPTAALTDMAQVIPRGARTVLIMLNEEAFAKPVMSALLSSPFSLTPSPSATNPLELVVPIPPPSAELRAQTLSQVDKFKDRADFALRDGRADTQKELRALLLANQIRPDDHRDIMKKMEKIVEETKAEIKRLCDASRKALQQ